MFIQEQCVIIVGIGCLTFNLFSPVLITVHLIDHLSDHGSQFQKTKFNEIEASALRLL